MIFLQVEDYCRLGIGGMSHNEICRQANGVSADGLLSNNNALATTSCPGVKDLLNAISLTWVRIPTIDQTIWLLGRHDFIRFTAISRNDSRVPTMHIQV